MTIQVKIDYLWKQHSSVSEGCTPRCQREREREPWIFILAQRDRLIFTAVWVLNFIDYILNIQLQILYAYF